MANDVKLNLTIDKRKADRALNGVEKKTSALSSKFASFGGVAAVATASVVALGAGLTYAVGQAAKFQKINTQFKTLTGSLENATRLTGQLADFSAKTPFQFEDIAQASAKLLSFGTAQSEVVDRLEELGDVAAASGSNIQDLTLIFGQVQAAGKLTGERLLQLQERAVPIGPALAKTMGVAESSIRTLVSQGKVDFETFQRAFASLSDEGQFAFKGMEEQSKTFSGAVSTLKDNISLLAADLGAKLLPAATKITQALTAVAQKGRDFITAISGSEQEQKLLAQRTKLDLLTTGLGNLNKRLTEVKSGNAGFFTSLFDSRSAAELTKRIDNQKAKIAELSASIKESEKEASAGSEEQRKLDAAKAAQVAEERLQKERELQAGIAELRMVGAENQKALDEEEVEQLRLKLEMENQAKIEARATDLANKGQHEEALKLLDEESTKAKLKQVDMQKKADELRAANLNTTLGTISTLTASGNKELFAIGKAAALAQHAISVPKAISTALASAPPPYNFALAALVGVAMAAQGAQIAAAKPTGFADGGLVTGGLQGRDSVPAMLAPGELVVPTNNFEEVIGAVNNQRSGGSMEVIIGFKDSAMEIIEEKILERRELGISAI